MRRLLLVVGVVLLVGCGASGGEATSSSTTTSGVSTSSTAPPTTTEPPTTTTMPKDLAVAEMSEEVQRACAEAVSGLSDPTIRYRSAWSPYRTRTSLINEAKACVQSKWDAVVEAERKAEEERRRAEEQRRAEEEAARGTVSQQNARAKAAEYLDFTAFSRSGLIDQLEYEGFSEGDAAFGIDALNVDWNEQAARMAAKYLDFTAFSRSGLIEQLVYEGFTQEQAEYGVSTTGL